MPAVTAIIFVSLMAAVLVWDAAKQRIPNLLIVAGLLGAIALRSNGGTLVMAAGLAGAGLGLAVGLPLWALRALGGGDAKLLAVVGAFLGPAGLPTALLATAITGGVLGLVVAVRRGVVLPVLAGSKDLIVNALTFGRAGERATLDTPGALKVPYGVAIAIGSVAAWFMQGGPTW